MQRVVLETFHVISYRKSPIKEWNVYGGVTVIMSFRALCHLMAAEVTEQGTAVQFQPACEIPDPCCQISPAR